MPFTLDSARQGWDTTPRRVSAVLILLPPSEGKAVPRRGKPLALAGLSFRGLTPEREQVLDALVALAHRDDAARVLGLGGTQGDLVGIDQRLRTAATAR